jgi:hypothetical protein
VLRENNEAQSRGTTALQSEPLAKAEHCNEGT